MTADSHLHRWHDILRGEGVGEGIYTWRPGEPIVELRVVDPEKYTIESVFEPKDSDFVRVAEAYDLNLDVIREITRGVQPSINTLVIEVGTFREIHGGYNGP